ncbi:MAG TPA: response regulator [Nitrososphaera sp.]|nr:response regulator [Nitrososphaera sp.]
MASNGWSGSFSLPVVARILNVLADDGVGIKRTNLAGRTGLNYGACVRYIELLHFLRWVKVSDEPRGQVYITQLGREFLLHLQKLEGGPQNDRSTDYLKTISMHMNHSSHRADGAESMVEQHLPSGYRSFGKAGISKAELGGAGNIMVVEDEEDILLTYEVCLREQGFNVYGFSDPGKALHAFEKSLCGSIDVIISDIRMTSINGMQLYKKIRSVNPEAKIIFISALDVAPEITSALPGFKRKDLLTKPISQGTLLRAISEAIVEARRSNVSE